MSFDLEKEMVGMEYVLLWRRKIRFGKIGLGLGWMNIVAGYRQEKIFPGDKSWCAAIKYLIDPPNHNGCGGYLFSKFFETEKEAQEVLMNYGHQEILTTIDFD